MARGERTGSTAVGGGVQSVGSESVGTEPAGTKSVGAGPAGTESVGAQPAGTGPAGTGPGAGSAAGAAPTTGTGEPRPADWQAAPAPGTGTPADRRHGEDGEDGPQERTAAGGAGDGPFTPRQLFRIDEALSAADRETGLTFSVYVGELAEPTRATAEGLLERLPHAADAVLLAVSPGQRVLEIVTGAHTTRRLPDRVCALAALSMTAAFGGGDLTGGVVTGLRMLADQAAQGVRPHRGPAQDREAGDPTV